MSDEHRKPQKRWNDENYKQFNIALRPELIGAFREACARNGVSMRAELASHMTEYASILHSQKKGKNESKYHKRNDRRKATGLIVAQLEAICAQNRSI